MKEANGSIYRPHLLLFASLCATLWTIAGLVAFVPFALAFLDSDNTYAFSGSLSFDGLSSLTNSSTWIALGRSIAVSSLAAVLGLLLVELLRTAFAKLGPIAVVICAVAVCVDPVVRSRAYRDALSAASSVAEPLGLDVALMVYVGPAVVLAMHYIPIFLLLRLFNRERETPARLRWIESFLFLRMPTYLAGLPISFAFFMLLSLFDLWLVRVVSGGTHHYWGTLLYQRGLSSRDLQAAATMIAIGLVVVMASYAATTLVSRGAQVLLGRLRPVSVRKSIPYALSKVAGALEASCTVLALLFLSFPLCVLFLTAIRSAGAGSVGIPMDYQRSIATSLILTTVCLATCITAGTFLYIHQLFSTRKHLWLKWPSIILALAPEAAFVLLVVLLTASGVVPRSFATMVVAVSSFALPIAYLMLRALVPPRLAGRLEVAGLVSRRRVIRGTIQALREGIIPVSVLTAFLAWLITEDVILVNVTSQPGGKPFSAEMFARAHRDLSGDDVFASLLMTAVRATIVLSLIVAGRALAPPSSEGDTHEE